MKLKIFRCRHCGNVVIKAVDSGVKMVCCGEPMQELIALTEDAGMEKHVPVITMKDAGTLHVDVGSVAHPMLPEHHIEFVILECENSVQVKWLTDKPMAEFKIGSDKPKTVYEYCNLHGLWKKDV